MQVGNTTILLRSEKGSELTISEMDANIEGLCVLLQGLLQTGAQVYDPAYPAVRLNSLNPQVVIAAAHVFSGGAVSAFAFTHHTGVKFYGQGHALAAANLDKVLTVADGGARVQYWGRLLVHNGDITVYTRKNGAGGYTAIDARVSDVGADAEASGFRGEDVVTMLATDYIEFFVAPCNGAGDIAGAVTARAELSVLALNWR